MKYLLNSITPWDEPPRLRHQLAEALSSDNDVYFITRNKFGWPRIETEKLNKNLTLLTPFFPIDFRIRWRLPVVNELIQFWLFSRVSKTLPDKSLRVINFDFTATQIFRFYKDVVYYCYDENLETSISKSPIVSVYFKYVEALTAKKSMFCVSVCNYLVQKLRKYNEKSYLLHNAVSDGVFGQRQYKMSEEQYGKNYVLWVGYISDRLNTEWLRHLSDNMPDIRIIMAGPIKGGIAKKLRKNHNIEFIGPKEGAELYSLLANASALIFPFKEDRYTREIACMQNKFWLYLAFGKPIVSVDIPNILVKKRGFFYMSKNKEEFTSNIRTAIEEDNEELKAQRIAYARENTWGKRVEELEKLYEKNK